MPGQAGQARDQAPIVDQADQAPGRPDQARQPDQATDQAPGLVRLAWCPVPDPARSASKAQIIRLRLGQAPGLVDVAPDGSTATLTTADRRLVFCRE